MIDRNLTSPSRRRVLGGAMAAAMLLPAPLAANPASARYEITARGGRAHLRGKREPTIPTADAALSSSSMADWGMGAVILVA